MNRLRPERAARPSARARFSLAQVLLLLVGAVGITPALAQAPGPAPPGVVTGGSQDVMVGGKTAARSGDPTSAGAIVEGSRDVFIDGKPAAIGGSRTGCGGVVVGTGSGVFINGKPLARSGDSATGCR
jgi:uncharacterized Zn-binding protein involved in type VI secretion